MKKERKKKQQMSGTAVALRSTKCGRRALDGWGAWHGCGQQKRTAPKWCFNTSQAVILWCSSRPPHPRCVFLIQAVTGDACCSFFFHSSPPSSSSRSFSPSFLSGSHFHDGGGGLSAQTIWWGFLEGGGLLGPLLLLPDNKPVASEAVPFVCFFSMTTQDHRNSLPASVIRVQPAKQLSLQGQ